jgi:hypothetical protein
LLAGRRFPGGDETVLVGFRTPVPGLVNPLPEGRGFRVERPPPAIPDRAHQWLALSRQPSGSSDLFAAMCADVVCLLSSSNATGSDRLAGLFLARIRAWQAFMEKDEESVLGPEAEIGLYGELTVLAGLLDAGLGIAAAVDCWRGPLDSLQDFEIGSSAIEVKTTIAASGFPATIWSLEQLDDAARHPLFLAGVRLAPDASGRSLPELALRLRERMRDEPETAGRFATRLLQAGYADAFADRYLRHFLHVRTAVLAVDAQFPRLIRASVPAAITRLWYVIDLDLLATPDIGLRGALYQLGRI